MVAAQALIDLMVQDPDRADLELGRILSMCAGVAAGIVAAVPAAAIADAGRQASQLGEWILSDAGLAWVGVAVQGPTASALIQPLTLGALTMASVASIGGRDQVGDWGGGEVQQGLDWIRNQLGVQDRTQEDVDQVAQAIAGLVAVVVPIMAALATMAATWFLWRHPEVVQTIIDQAADIIVQLVDETSELTDALMPSLLSLLGLAI